MAVEFTTAAIVRSYLSGITTTSVADGTIEEFIEENEGFIETIFKLPSSFTFDANKKPHKALRKLVSILSALDLLAAVNQSFQTSAQATIAADVLKDQYEDTLKFLTKDNSYRQYIIDA